MSFTLAQETNLNNAMSANQDVALGTLLAATDLASLGGFKKVSQTVLFSEFTDGGAAVGTFVATDLNIPVGATVLAAAVTNVVGFAGNVSAVLTIGDGTDVDRYNTGTPSVFATAASGIAVGVASGTKYHDTAIDPVLTVTASSDFTAVSAGSLSISIYYLL